MGVAPRLLADPAPDAPSPVAGRDGMTATDAPARQEGAIRHRRSAGGAVRRAALIGGGCAVVALLGTWAGCYQLSSDCTLLVTCGTGGAGGAPTSSTSTGASTSTSTSTST